jgi:hypothetical protein
MPALRSWLTKSEELEEGFSDDIKARSKRAQVEVGSEEAGRHQPTGI